MADVNTASQLQDGWSGSQCPDYDGDDDEHEMILVDQQIQVVNGEPVIRLTAQCTCGWSDEKIID